MLVDEHPMYLAVLLYPEIDPTFNSSIFDDESLSKNFNQDEFDAFNKLKTKKKKNQGFEFVFEDVTNFQISTKKNRKEIY